MTTPLRPHLYWFLMIIGMTPLRVDAQKQGTDSKGKSVFDYYSLNEVRLNVDASEPLSLSMARPLSRGIFLRGFDTTVVKASQLTAKVSLLNAGEQVVISDLQDKRLGWGLDVGYQTAIDRAGKNFTGATYVWGVTLGYKSDNVKLFDVSDSTIRVVHPTSWSISGNLTWFAPDREGFRWMLAIGAKAERTWNKDDLLDFKGRSGAIVTSSVVAFTEPDGLFGRLDNEVDRVRLAVSAPLYFLQWNPMPFLVVVATSTGEPSYRAGMLINRLTNPFEATSFELPSSFGLGVDVAYTATDGVGPAALYVRGSIGLGKLDKTDRSLKRKAVSGQMRSFFE